MRRAVVWGALAALVLAASPLHAELRAWQMGFWKLRAEDCGHIYQFYTAHYLAHHFATLKEDMLESAHKDGANEEQLLELERKFQLGRKRAIQEGWVEDESKTFSEYLLNLLLKKVERRYKYCTETE